MVTPEDVFGDLVLGWGNKYGDSKLLDVWTHDRQYLLWAANLTKKPCDRPPSPDVVARIKIASLFAEGKTDEAEQLFSDFQRWEALSLRGEGLSDLPRPSRERCMEILSSCTLLAGHCDLDGIYSVAIAMARGGALAGGKMKGAFGRLRLLRYGMRSTEEYSQVLGHGDDDIMVIIDFAAHPAAALTLDHHVTALQFWELGARVPVGIFEPSMPSCPRLLATFCGLEVDERVLCGTDMVDGALYSTIEQATDLDNPFVALELALSLDVSDSVAKKVAFILAENDLRAEAVLELPVWRARRELLRLELEEQRSFWKKGGRIRAVNELTTLADGRLAPYSASRFRYIPFEFEEANKPYLVTLRQSGGSRINIGVARNPFFPRPEIFHSAPVNLGALCRSLGRGGGRQEAAAITVESDAAATIVEALGRGIENAFEKRPDPTSARR